MTGTKYKKIPKFKIARKKKSAPSNLGQMLGLAEDDALEKIRASLTSTRDMEYPGTDFKTVKEIFENSTEKYADNTFILDVFNRKKGFEEITYSEFRDDVVNFGTALMKVLKLEGEKVIIMAETTYEWYVSYIALLGSGIIAVPIDKEYPENELENVIRRSEAKAVICSPKKTDMAAKAASHTHSVSYIIEMYSKDSPEEIHPSRGSDRTEAETLQKIGFDYLTEEGSVCTMFGDTRFTDKEIDPNAFAVLIFTSGTTSAAKGVMISNHNLASNINAITPYVRLYPDDRLFSVLPLHHTYESTIGFIYPMAMGASIAVCQGLKHLVSDMELTSPTSIIAVPLLIETVYKRIIKSIEKAGKAKQVESLMKISDRIRSLGLDATRALFDEIYRSLGGRLRIIVTAAAPTDVKVGNWFASLGILFLQGYGLTETAPIAALTPDFDLHIGSAGKCVHGNEIMIHEPNSSGEGEVWIKGETVMLGYYNDPESTSEVMHDGWFNSGDIGYLDNEGFLYITGRSKNVIVTQNGKNIYPEELEGILNNLPEIQECMVYGKGVEGEKELTVTARVIPDYDKIIELHEDMLKDYDLNELKPDELPDDKTKEILWKEIKKVNSGLSNYKYIRDLEIKHGTFEKTSTMKIKRYAELKK